ncbi:putative membrane protein YccC [Microbacteriaceae bacterium SG_E_30_P1]|uniref:Membrane protein YccC n=1 Tax=Antiquaquibacter oligotrophicus TaxID=2880260 RepID=A0ABT6KK85_9MICO|nr:hypothetical protein [Antiquaquibacter oligotrophicus]MDH6180396.1 putative membrane protein YccC [Antiquaquibacter oligotrophicus]UDF13863.1 hypothetical protein LH407_03125 [Antiquaquibacter oligotrophicus]
MRFFRRRKKLDLGKYVAPKQQPEAPLQDLIDEGVLIAAAAVRLAVKNLMVLRSVRDGLNYDEERYVTAVREELQNLADEKDGDAMRVARLSDDAAGRTGKATHHADYREVDTDRLSRREQVLRQLARRLRSLADDDEWVRDLVASSRGEALEDLAASADAVSLAERMQDTEEYRELRADRMRNVKNDLLMLQVTPPENR